MLEGLAEPASLFAMVAFQYAGWALIATTQNQHYSRVFALGRSARCIAVVRHRACASALLLSSATLSVAAHGLGFGSLIWFLSAGAVGVAVAFALARGGESLRWVRLLGGHHEAAVGTAGSPRNSASARQ